MTVSAPTAQGTCPACDGTTRIPVGEQSRRYLRYNARWGHWGIAGYQPAGPGPFVDGQGYEGGTLPCTNCGGQTMFGTPTGLVPLRADGTPCLHTYAEHSTPQERQRGAHRYRCTGCGERNTIDSGD